MFVAIFFFFLRLFFSSHLSVLLYVTNAGVIDKFVCFIFVCFFAANLLIVTILQRLFFVLGLLNF
jgi:hypothetical protein